MKNTYDKFTELCSLKTQELIEKFKNDYKSRKIKSVDNYLKELFNYPNIIYNKDDKDFFIVNENNFSVCFAYNNYSDSCAIRYLVEKDIDKDHKLSIAFGDNFSVNLSFACFELIEKGNETKFNKNYVNTIRYIQEDSKDISISVFEIKRLSDNLKKDFTLLNDLNFANMLLSNYFELKSIKDIVLLSHDIDIEKNQILLSIIESTKNQNKIKQLKK